MRISNEALPDGSELLRLHESESEEYTKFVVVKPLGFTNCELSGFSGEPSREELKLLFRKCEELGYDFVHIERRKDGIRRRKVFKLCANS